MLIPCKVVEVVAETKEKDEFTGKMYIVGGYRVIQSLDGKNFSILNDGSINGTTASLHERGFMEYKGCGNFSGWFFITHLEAMKKQALLVTQAWEDCADAKLIIKADNKQQLDIFNKLCEEMKNLNDLNKAL